MNQSTTTPPAPAPDADQRSALRDFMVADARRRARLQSPTGGDAA